MQNLTRNILDTCLEIWAVSRVLLWRDKFRFYRCFIRNAPNLVKERSLRPLDICMNRKCITLDIDCLGKRFHLSDYDFGLVREIYARRIYFPTDDWIPKEGDFVIDLGANVGMATLLCAKLGADVLAVEAQDGFIPCIRKNLSENGCVDHVNVIHGLVGSGSGVFSSGENFWSADHFYGNLPKTISIEEILDDYPNRRIKLLKMDIEGGEFSLFNDKLGWLVWVDCIAMEVHGKFGDPEIIMNKLECNGFDAKLYNGRRHPIGKLRCRGDNGLIFAVRSK